MKYQASTPCGSEHLSALQRGLKLQGPWRPDLMFSCLNRACVGAQIVLHGASSDLGRMLIRSSLDVSYKSC